MSNIPQTPMEQIPTDYLSFLSPSSGLILTSKKAKSENYKSQVSAYPSTLSSIPKFLETKILSLESEVDYLQSYNLAIRGLQREGIISDHACLMERNRLEHAEYALREENIAVQLGGKIIKEDMADELTNSGRLIEDAYAISMVHRVQIATGKQQRSPFNRCRFKKDVLEHYQASEQEGTPSDGWCHLLGPCPAEEICAAHLVPKSLEQDSVTYLFGGEVKPAVDVRNALLLHKNVEWRLDSGDIAIVPKAGKENEWKCIVTRKEKLNDMIGPSIRLMDIHEKQLEFRSANRPAKRYLFFRYLMTYLSHKSEGNVEWAQQVNMAHQGWATPGKYLRNSTLRVLARKAFGEDLPEEMFRAFDKVMFPDDEGLSRDLEQKLRAERGILNLKKLVLPPAHIANGNDSDEEDDIEEYDSAED